MKIINFNFLVLISIITYPFTCFSSPTIAGVTISGNSLNINGKEFGAKPNPAPIRFDNFEKLTVGNDVASETGWWSNSSNAGNAMKVSNDYSISGQNSAKATQLGNELSNPMLMRNNIGFADTKKVLVSFWFRWKWPEWTGGTPYEGVQYKLWRVAASLDTNGNVHYPAINDFKWKGATYTWNTLGLTYTSTSALGSYSSVHFPNDSVVDNTWYNVVLMVNQGTKGVANGSYKAYLSKASGPYTEIASATNILIIDSYGDYINAIKLDNYIDKNNDNIVAQGATIANNGIYFDDIYIDNTFSRIEIGDSPEYQNCTKRIIQIPSAWTDTSVTATLNQGNFTSGQTTYLYLVNSSGAVNANGYPITIGVVESKPTIISIQ